MNNAITSWDDDYARHARAAALLRADFPNISTPHSNQLWQERASSIQTGLNRLSSHLYYYETHLSLSPAEVTRRRSLLEGLKDQLSSQGSAEDGGDRGASFTATALGQQDEMIKELAKGVEGVKNRTKFIKREIDSHVEIVHEIDGNADLIKEELDAAMRRTKKFRKENRKILWRLHLITAGLGVLLFLLILMGVS